MGRKTTAPPTLPLLSRSPMFTELDPTLFTVNQHTTKVTSNELCKGDQKKIGTKTDKNKTGFDGQC